MGCVCIKKQRIVQYAFKDKLMLSFPGVYINVTSLIRSFLFACPRGCKYCVRVKKEQCRSKLCYTAEMTARFPDQLCG